jgi:hypothetical protein
LKVFIGTYENCGIIHYLSNGFKELNHDVTTMVKNEHRFSYCNSYTIKEIAKKSIGKTKMVRKVFSEINNYRYTLKLRKHFQVLKENDLFVFIWDSILPGLKDLEELKKLGKKIVFLFIGSDVRHMSAFEQEFPGNSVCWRPYQLKEDLNKKLEFIRKVELLADKIYSVPDQAGLQLLPYNHFFLPLDINNINYNFPNNDVPVIVHAPSNPGLKGTSLILNALENLKQEGVEFELKLLQNVSNVDVKTALTTADIAVDQIHLHGPGMFGLEAMAHGCALATRYLKEHANVFSPRVHYIDDSDNLTDNLRELIISKELRRELAFAGRQFVERNNNPKQIAQSIIDNLEIANREFDYTPTFFLEDFDLKGVRLKKKVRELNRQVIEKLNCKTTNYRPA